MRTRTPSVTSLILSFYHAFSSKSQIFNQQSLTINNVREIDLAHTLGVRACSFFSLFYFQICLYVIG